MTSRAPAAPVRPEWAGWLPDPVQAAANAAARAGLIPIVCDDDESFDLWAPGGHYLACVGELGGVVVSYLDEYDAQRDDECWEVCGFAAVLAYAAHITATTATVNPTPGDDR